MSRHISGVCSTKRASMPRLSATCSAFIVSSRQSGIAGIIGLAHAGDQVLQPAPIGQRRGEGEEDQVAAGDEGVGQAVRLHGDRGVAGQRGVGDRPRSASSVDQWSSPSRRRPVRDARGAAGRGRCRGSPARRGGAGRNRSRWSRHGRSGRSAQARQVVESWPPENSTRAASSRIMPPVACAAQRAASATTGSGSSARACATGRSAGSAELPIAISTLRTKRSRPMRLTGDAGEQRAEAGIVERGELGQPRRRQLGARQRSRARACARANLFHGQTARQSSQP